MRDHFLSPLFLAGLLQLSFLLPLLYVQLLAPFAGDVLLVHWLGSQTAEEPAVARMHFAQWWQPFPEVLYYQLVFFGEVAVKLGEIVGVLGGHIVKPRVVSEDL